MTEDQLRELSQDLESDLIERKQNASDLDRISEAVCAFSNDLPNRRSAGYVIIGLRDDGTCANLNVDDSLLLRLSSIRDNGRILPLPMLSIEREELDGCELVIIEVRPHPNPPVRFSGRTWVRIGPRRALATVDEERVLSERSRSNTRSYDQRSLPGATMDDINAERFRTDYLPQAVSFEVLAQNGRSLSAQLGALRLLGETGAPNLVAILSLADDPRRLVAAAYIQFVRFDGTDIFAPIADEKEIDGPLAEILLEADDVIRANSATAIDFKVSATQTTLPQYPLVALQQLLRNAVMHRSYENTNAPIRFYWFSDRVEIHNPGGLFGQVNESNFGRPGITDYRNPLLAEAMKTLGFVQRFGIGVATATRALQDNGNPEPRFTFDLSAVVVVVYKR